MSQIDAIKERMGRLRTLRDYRSEMPITGLDKPDFEIFETMKESHKSTKIYEKFQKKTGKNFPASLARYYKEAGILGIDIVYFLPAENRKIFGRSGMFFVDSIMDHPSPRVTRKPKHGNALWIPGDDPAIIDKLQEYYIFDNLFYDFYILMKVVDNSPEPELYLYMRPHILAKLHLTVEQYYDMNLKAGGIFLWQQYFTDRAELPYLLPDNLHENIKTVFPETDVSEFPKPDRPYLPYKIHAAPKTSYQMQLMNLEQELRKNPVIKFEKMEMNVPVRNGAHPGDIYRCYLALGYALPDQVLQFYQTVFEIKMSWSPVKSPNMNCNFGLLSLEDIFCGLGHPDDWAYRRRWDYTAADMFKEWNAAMDDYEELKTWRVLYRGERDNILIRFHPDKDPELLYVHDIDTYPMEASFIELVEGLIAFKGISYFGKAYIGNHRYTKDTVENFRALFPDSPLPERFRAFE